MSASNRRIWSWFFCGLFFVLIVGSVWIFFAREERRFAYRTACVSRLHFIWMGKQACEDLGYKKGDFVPIAQLDKEMPAPLNRLKCPSGGTYTIGAIGEDATCSYTNVAYTYRFDVQTFKFEKRAWFHTFKRQWSKSDIRTVEPIPKR
jgi:hypothetical protein